MTNKKIAVILWLYHTDLYDKFLNLLTPLDNDIHLYLGLCDNNTLPVEQAFTSSLSRVTINYFPNTGGDVLPFLTQLRSLPHNTHDYCIKIHSKKSKYGFQQQVDWLSVLLDSLLSLENFYSVLKRLQYHDMVGCQALIFKNQEYTNSHKIQEICQKLNTNISMLKHKKFIAGNMFAARLSILDIFIQHFDTLKECLSTEHGHISDETEGKYAHSMERLFGYFGSLKTPIGYPLHNKVKILSSVPNTKKLHLNMMYNNDCYISENINIYGKIIDKNDQYLAIQWLNQKQPKLQYYRFINETTLVNSKSLNTTMNFMKSL